MCFSEMNKMLDPLTLYIGFGTNNSPAAFITEFEREPKFDKKGKRIERPPPPPAVLGVCFILSEFEYVYVKF